MFVLIMGTAQFLLTSEQARNLYTQDGHAWKQGPSMADRCIITTAAGYSLTAPLNWRDMIGATK